jgi:flagellar biosynthesis/type III secretory pathway protein FliH
VLAPAAPIVEVLILSPFNEKDSPYAKATEVMETIARTAQERQLYESRRKAELDYRSGLDEALALGMEKGERLALLDQVRFLQGLLQESLSAESELQAMDLAALRRLCGELKERLRQAR